MKKNHVLENAIGTMEALRSVVLSRATEPNEFITLEKEAHAAIQQLKSLKGEYSCD